MSSPRNRRTLVLLLMLSVLARGLAWPHMPWALFNSNSSGSSDVAVGVRAAGGSAGSDTSSLGSSGDASIYGIEYDGVDAFWDASSSDSDGAEHAGAAAAVAAGGPAAGGPAAVAAVAVPGGAEPAYRQEVWAQGTEYMMPSRRASSAFSRRRLQQQAPSLCGKLGTYVPNYYSTTDGSMFGVSISPNSDGSIVGVGAPLNGPDATKAGHAMVLTSWSKETCEYAVTPLWQPAGGYRYFGAQVALSADGTTFVVMDGVEGIQTASMAGNRPVVHVYWRYTNGTYVYRQKLSVAPRKAMAASMSVSITANAQMILVSYSVGEGFPDKRGSAQVFVLNGTKGSANYTYLQDLANLNMPAGSSVQFGASSLISADGSTVAVGTAAATNTVFKMVYMYRRDTFTGRFRIVSSIADGEYFADPWGALTGVGITDDNALSMTQSGRFVLRVENSMLVIYEWSGSGMTMTWKRRCQLSAPDGYTFRTTGGSLSIVEVSNTRVKFAAGAYIGTLEAPEQMAVFLYYLNTAKAGSCPFRPAEKHVHNDPFSNYGAGVALTPAGNLLVVGAPTNWDNNMDYQVGAVYMLDVSTVADDGLIAKTITAAANTNAGCINGLDPNGNPCVNKQAGTILCKDVKKADGTVIHYGPAGCTPTPSPPSFWTASVDDTTTNAFRASSVSAYSTIAPSIKGGVGVPVGSNPWLANQVNAQTQANYFGVPTTALTNPKTSVVSAAGWPTSATPALGGLSANTPGGAAPAPAGVSILSVLGDVGSSLLSGLARGGSGGATPAGIGGLTGGLTGGSTPGRTTSLGLPPGAVITNAGLLSQGAGAAG